MAWQVHGADVREVDERPAPGRFLEPGAEAFPKSDGLVDGPPGPAAGAAHGGLHPGCDRPRGRAPAGRAARRLAGARGRHRRARAWRGRPAAVRPQRSGRGRGRAATRWGRMSPASCATASARTSSATAGPTCGWRAAGARGRRRGRCGGRGRVLDLRRGALLLAPARPWDHRPPGRGGGARCLIRRSSRATWPACARRWGRTSRSWRRRSTSTPPTWRRSARAASPSSARTAPTPSSRSRSASATRSPGTSSAMSRAARCAT